MNKGGMRMKTKILKAIGAVIAKWIAEVLWPWFKEYIWPEIQTHILGIIKNLLFMLASRIQEHFNNKCNRKKEENEDKQAATQHKFDDAMQKASHAKTPEEAAKYIMTANIWKEVLIWLQEENEALRTELAELKDYIYTNVQELSLEAEKEVTDINPHIEIPKDISEKLLMAIKEKIQLDE
jgi:hypothetical protein